MEPKGLKLLTRVTCCGEEETRDKKEKEEEELDKGEEKAEKEEETEEEEGHTEVDVEALGLRSSRKPWISLHSSFTKKP